MGGIKLRHDELKSQVKLLTDRCKQLTERNEELLNVCRLRNEGDKIFTEMTQLAMDQLSISLDEAVSREKGVIPKIAKSFFEGGRVKSIEVIKERYGKF